MQDALAEFVSNEKYKHSVAYLDDLIVACDLDDVVAAQTRWQTLLDKHELRAGFAAQLVCPLVNAWVTPGSMHAVSNRFRS